MARLRPNLHTMVYRLARIQGVLKVKIKVKGHVSKSEHADIIPVATTTT